jgi:hypothetical protein
MTEIKRLNCKNYLLKIAGRGEVGLITNPKCIYYYTGYVECNDEGKKFRYVEHHRPFDLSGYAVFYKPRDNISLSEGFSQERYPETSPVFSMEDHYNALWRDIKKFNPNVVKPDIFCGRNILKDLALIGPNIVIKRNKELKKKEFNEKNLEFYAFFIDDVLFIEQDYMPEAFNLDSYTGFNLF